MSEWKEVILGEVCVLVAGFAFKSRDFGDYPRKVLKIADINPPFVSNDDSLGIDLSKYDERKLEKYIVKKGDYILAMTGATIGKLGRYISEDYSYLNQRVLKFCPKNCIDSNFLYYILCGNYFAKYVINHIDSESAQPNISAGTIGKFKFKNPHIEEQRRIASILSSLDDKIAINRRICENLEAQAQALFKHWFIDFAPFKDGKFVESELGMIPEGWRVGRLTEIADYMNGLAMQKFPPLSENDAIPVLKIKELGQSQCDANSDKCSKQIKPEYIVNNGDVVFSWSGTLLVDIWCGGVCGLNQHLFKVTSKDYPKWFYLMWTKHHLAEFIRIAKDKAVTMGHIKRGDLEDAFVCIPDAHSMAMISPLMGDIVEKIIKTRLESSRLSTLRDTLLPKLMSGEIKV